MCGVIVVDAGMSQSPNLRRDAYIHDHCLVYRHNYLLFYQLPNSNLFTHRMLFTFPLLFSLHLYVKNTKNIVPIRSHSCK